MEILGQVQVPQGAEGLELRAYLVGRDGALAEAEVDARGAFRLPLAPEQFKAGGLTVEVAPAAPYAEVVSRVDRVRVPLGQENLDPAGGVIHLKERLVIDAWLAGIWRRLFRRFCVRGRVVCLRRIAQFPWFAFEPVAGARVRAFEVDRMFPAGYSRAYVGADITDANGYFEVCFPWYHCLLLRPHFPINLEKLRPILERIPGPGPGPGPDPAMLADLEPLMAGALGDAIQERATCCGGQAPRMAQANLLPGALPELRRPNLPNLLFPGINLDELFRPECQPDLAFEVAQMVGGAWVTILDEPNTRAHSNLSEGAMVTLVVPAARCGNAGVGCSPNTFCGFEWVGEIATSDIAADGYARTLGYAWGPRVNDAAFGLTLRLRGGSAGTDYYKIQYQAPGSSKWVDWTLDYQIDYWTQPLLPPFVRHHQVFTRAPRTMAGVDNLYTALCAEAIPLPAGHTGPFFRPEDADLLVRLDTTKLPTSTGLYRFRVVPYDVTANGAAPRAACPDLVLRIDNTAPVARFLRLRRTGPSGALTLTPGDLCPSMTLQAGDSLSIDYDARDAEGHLLDYSILAYHGYSAQDWLVSPVSYPVAGLPGKLMHGSLGLTATTSDAFWAGLVAAGGGAEPTACPYTLELRVHKRVTNGDTGGYPNIYAQAPRWSIIVER